MEIIKSKAESFENDYGGKVAINIVDVSSSEKIFSRNSDEILSLGSTPKIAIVRALLEWSKQEGINLEDEITIRNSLKPRNYGDGDDKVTYIDAMNEIIKDSNGRSNAYANFVIDKIGLRRLNKIIHEQGYNDTTFVDYYLPRSNYRGNTSSLNDVNRMLLDILKSKGLDPIQHEQALEALGMLKGREGILGLENFEGVDESSILMKHGQSEKDMTILYRISGEIDGEKYDRIVSFSLSGLKQRLVKGDFKSPTSFGANVWIDFYNFVSENVAKFVASSYTNR